MTEAALGGGRRHFLALADAGADGLAAILADAAARKAARGGLPKGAPDADAPLAGRLLACLFEKNSTRTRVSFDVAVRQLGGASIVMDAGQTQLGRGESVADTARVLSAYVDAIMVRTDDPAKLAAMAAQAGVPVVNGLTDASHPCQLVADLLTLAETGRDLAAMRVAWVGDGNNVLASWLEAAGLLGFRLTAACPPGHAPAAADLAAARGRADVVADPAAAATGADVVVTDCWLSMGDADTAAKLAALRRYQVTEALMALARPDAAFLHCLPAHRGEEVAAAVIDGPRSLVWAEAENRLHAQKAVLRWCFGQVG